MRCQTAIYYGQSARYNLEMDELDSPNYKVGADNANLTNFSSNGSLVCVRYQNSLTEDN